MERRKRRKCEKCVMLGTEEGRMRANGQRNEGPERKREREGGREEKEEKRARIATQRGARGRGRAL